MAAQFGYNVHLPSMPTAGLRAVGSWLLIRGDIPSRPVFSLHKPYVDFFGSYVAGARVVWPGLDDVVVFSIHASPRPVPPGHLHTWPGDLPEYRLATEGILRELYYVDFVLAMLTIVAGVVPVLAAGDFNEARSRDLHGRPGWTDDRSFGREFFRRAEASGFIDVTYRDWGEERQTLFHRDLPPYQSDHVLATTAMGPHLSVPVVDPMWANPAMRSRMADHAPVWFKARI